MHQNGICNKALFYIGFRKQALRHRYLLCLGVFLCAIDKIRKKFADYVKVYQFMKPVKMVISHQINI